MKIKLRNMCFAHAAVHDIHHVALVPEVQQALAAWIKAKTETCAPGVLIGGLAMSFYAKPRYTEDADILFLSATDIPETVKGFKRTRSGAFQENKTHVEVEVVTTQSINQTQELVKKVIETAVIHDGIKVASIEGLIALKLVASDNPKRKHRDLGDIDLMLENNPRPDMSEWPIEQKHFTKFEELCEVIYK